MAAAGVVVTFTEQAQGAERGRDKAKAKAKAVSQRAFKRVARLLVAGGVGQQPFKAGSAEFAKGELVGRFGPDELGRRSGKVSPVCAAAP